MAPVSITSLPSELLCRIFESAEDFSVVAALVRTAWIFNNVWRANSRSICEAIAPRQFSNFASAKRLVEVEEESEALSQLQPWDEITDKAVSRVKRLFYNARCASAACDCWVDVCEIHLYPDRDRDNAYMTPAERARFEYAFYTLWAVSIMARTSGMKEQASAFLNACSPRELFKFNEMSYWCASYNDNEFGSLDLDLRDETWTAGYKLVSKHWHAYYYGSGLRGIVAPHRTPLGFFAFFDHTQRYLRHIPDHY